MAEGSSRGGFATAPLFDPEPRGKNAHADRKPHLEEKPNSAEHASSFFWGRTDEVDGGISGRGHRHKRPGPKPEETPVIQTFRHGSQLVRKGRERLDAEAQGSRKHAGIQKPQASQLALEKLPTSSTARPTGIQTDERQIRSLQDIWLNLKPEASRP